MKKKIVLGLWILLLALIIAFAGLVIYQNKMEAKEEAEQARIEAEAEAAARQGAEDEAQDRGGEACERAARTVHDGVEVIEFLELHVDEVFDKERDGIKAAQDSVDDGKELPFQVHHKDYCRSSEYYRPEQSERHSREIAEAVNRETEHYLVKENIER